MSMAGEIAEEYYEPIIAQLRTDLAVVKAGLDRAVAALTEVKTAIPGSNQYLVAAQALKDIAAITATLNKEEAQRRDGRTEGMRDV